MEPRRRGRLARLAGEPSPTGNGRARVPGRLPAARRRSRPGGDFSGRRTWPPSSPPAVGVESETVALEPGRRRERPFPRRPRGSRRPRRQEHPPARASEPGPRPPPGSVRRRTAPGNASHGGPDQFSNRRGPAPVTALPVTGAVALAVPLLVRGTRRPAASRQVEPDGLDFMCFDQVISWVEK